MAEAATDATRIVKCGEAGAAAGLFVSAAIILLRLSLGTPEAYFLFGQP
jgi:hypothetical protein